jgi:hypothetical protein
MSVWFVDDARAFRMAPADWYLEGAQRFGLALVGAAAFGAAAYFKNRRWVALPGLPRIGALVALLIAVAVALSGAATHYNS